MHTDGSIFDAIIKPKELIDFALENHHKAVMVSNHGTMNQSLILNQLCKENNLKYIPAMEGYLCDNVNIQDDTLYHILFFAKDKIGYKNLLNLTSISHQNFYKRPRLDWNILKDLAKEGLGCTSACLGGVIKRDDYDACLDRLAEMFKDNFFIELHCYGQSEQEKMNIRAIKYAKSRGIKTIIATDSHYVKESDADVHRQWKNIKKGSDYFPDNSLYLHTLEDARQTCKGCDIATFDDSCRTLMDISASIDVVIGDDNKHYPKYGENTNPNEVLRDEARKGYRRIIGGKNPVYQERAKYELDVFEKLGYADYILILQDMMKYCRANGIAVGPGRGSCCGSLICYLVGITEIDPIKNDIIFERFAHADRVSDPDIDVDVSQARRGEVIKFLNEKYGQVYNIRTYNTLSAKGAIKRACQALSVPPAIADEITATIVDDNIDTAKHQTPDLANIIALAKRFDGLISNASVHASGVLILVDDPSNYCSVESQIVGDKKYFILSQEFPHLEKLGLMKLDVLGLRNVDIVQDCINDIPEQVVIPETDEKTYDMLCKGNTYGCFQIEGHGMTSLAKRLQPRNLDDLSLMVALFRPGPLQAGFVDEAVKNKKERAVIEDNILAKAYGVLAYQEQVMEIFRRDFGYSLSQADLVRRAIGKKKQEELEKIISSCLSKNPNAKPFLDKIIGFADYCFNRAHSVAYATLAYRTAYLKANYPLYYFKALLNSVIGDMEKTAKCVLELRKLGIKVHTPKVGISQSLWTSHDDELYAGLFCVKGISDNTPLKNVMNADFESVLNSEDLRKNQIENLAKIGYFNEEPEVCLHKLLLATDIGAEISHTAKKISEWEAKEDGKNKERFLKLYNERIKELRASYKDKKDNKTPKIDLPQAQIEILGFSENGVLAGYDDSGTNGINTFLARVTGVFPHTMKNGKPMLFIEIERDEGSQRLVYFYDGKLNVGDVYYFRLQKENIVQQFSPAKKLIA